MDAPRDVAADKVTRRHSLGAVRAARKSKDLDAARDAVRAVVVERVARAGWRCVAAYVPLRTEPGSRELLDDLVAAAVRVLVPVTLPDRDLDWTTWRGDDERLGLDAVGGADGVLVPALAVAFDGTRLGRGGGSYDRALPRCRPGAVLAALLFDGELVSTLPSEPWDRPVTDVVTPSGWVHLGDRTRVVDGR